jgi:phage tail sheath gpL-like
MTISFNNIPQQRVPFVAIEVDPSMADQGIPQQLQKVLVLGQSLGGTAAVNQLCQINTGNDAQMAFSQGSMLCEMFLALKAADTTLETWAVPLADNPAGTAAAGSTLFTGPATAAGTLNCYIAGKLNQAAVTSAMTAAQLATAHVAAVTADGTMPVTAAVDGANPSKVNYTCKWKGLTGNDIDIRFNYQIGDAFPAGIGATVTPMSGGTANPDLTPVIVAMASVQWHAIITPYSDATSMATLEAELASRWLPSRQIDGIGFTAFRGTNSTTGTYGATRNSFLMDCIGTNIVPNPPYIWAAVNGIVSAAALAIDPARQLKTLPLTGLLPPAMGVAWDGPERNVLLYDGITTYTVDSGGTCRIDRGISMNQTNSSGIASDAFLDITTPALISYLRFSLIDRITSKYPRHKLADNGTKFGEGQPIVTPNILTAEQLCLAREWEDAGLVEDVDQFKADLVVERDPNNSNRVNALIPPNLINNFIQFAGLLQFRL